MSDVLEAVFFADIKMLWDENMCRWTGRVNIGIQSYRNCAQNRSEIFVSTTVLDRCISTFLVRKICIFAD